MLRSLCGGSRRVLNGSCRTSIDDPEKQPVFDGFFTLASSSLSQTAGNADSGNCVACVISFENSSRWVLGIVWPCGPRLLEISESHTRIKPMRCAVEDRSMACSDNPASTNGSTLSTYQIAILDTSPITPRLGHSPSQASQSDWCHDWLVLGILLAVGLALLPWCNSFVCHFPDERHYTDAALFMQQHGAYLTPHSAAGEPRYRKPILTYWFVLLGLEWGGVQPLSARLPFWLLSLASLGLTYATVCRVSGRRWEACLAVVFLLGQPEFLLASMRCLPDMPQLFGLTLSLYGGAGWLRGRSTRWSAWWIWLGLGLAVAAKGLLGVLLGGWIIVFWLLNHLTGATAKLVSTGCQQQPLAWPGSWPAVLVGFVLAGSWYGWSCWQHGSEFWRCFWGDQIGQKLVVNPLLPLWYIPRFLLLTLLSVLPASFLLLFYFLPLGLSRRSSFEPFWQRCRRGFAMPMRIWHWFLADRWLTFLLGWLLLNSLVFGCSATLHLRYGLFVAPTVAMLLTRVCVELCQRSEKHFWQSFRILLLVELGVSSSVALVLLILLCQLATPATAWNFAIAASGLLLLGWLGWWLCRQHRYIGLQGLWLATLLLILFWGMAPLALPDQAAQLNQTLTEVLPPQAQDTILYFYGKPALASKLRLTNSAWCIQWEAETPPVLVPDFCCAVVREDLLVHFPYYPGEIRVVGSSGWGKWPRQAWQGWWSGQLRALLYEHRQRHWIVYRSNPYQERAEPLPLAGWSDSLRR